MKGNKKILVVAILLLLIAVSYGTYAIYRESAEGTGTISTANWSVTVNNGTFENLDLDFQLSDLTCTTNPGKNGTIAPGANCYLPLTIDADGSEVDVVIEAEIDDSVSNALPDDIEVTVTDNNGSSEQDGTVLIPYSATAGAMEKAVRLNIVWPGALTDDSSKDTDDLAIKDGDYSLAVKVTARQALS